MRSLRRAIVNAMDHHFPWWITRARYFYHVQIRRSQVHPHVLESLFNHIGSRQQTAVDVGANRGVFSLYLARHFKSCLAVEPVPELAASLLRSVPRNVEVFSLAAGAETSMIELKIPIAENGTIMHALASAAPDNAFDLFPNQRISAIRVKQQMLDSLCSATEALGFIKIDVEGYENSVLEGAAGTLRRHQPVLLIEILPRFNSRYREVFSSVAAYGYRAFRFSGHGLSPMASLDIEEMATQELKHGGMDQVDYLFVPRQLNDWARTCCVRGI